MQLRIEFPPALMSRETAAYYLDMSIRELDDLRHAGELIPVGEGKRIKFRKTELDAYIERLPDRPRR